MIIVSQDKRMLINFDNIVGIVIRRNNEENVYQIQCKSGNEASKRILAKYSTEERAKEVLQEIIIKYEYAQRNLADANDVTPFDEGFIFRMPLE